jgi:hypothetical protein
MLLRVLFGLAGVVHFSIGVAGLALPRWFFDVAPPWPPLHVGQIQIAGIFDLSMGALFFGAARDPRRYLPLAVLVGVVAEWGHALVRIGHILRGSNPVADLFLPILMLSFGALLIALGTQRMLAERSG